MSKPSVIQFGLSSIAICIFVLISQTSLAARMSFFDIDGTLLMDRVSMGQKRGKPVELQPAFITYWELQLVAPSMSGQTQFNQLSAQGLLPEKIFLSRFERDQLRGRFAREDALTSHLSPVQLDADPMLNLAIQAYRRYGFNRTQEQVIYPGFYSEAAGRDQTFRFHRDSGFTRSPLLTDLEIAWQRYQSDPEKYRLAGKAMKYLNQTLLDLREGDLVYLITDRFHSAETGFKFLVSLRHKGLLSAEISNDRLRSVRFLFMNDYVTRTQFDRKKASAIIQKLHSLAQSGLPLHKVLSDREVEALQGITFDGHEVIVYENDPSYIDQIAREVGGELGFYSNIKFYVYHAGSEHEVRQSLLNRGLPPAEFPQRFLVAQPEAAPGTFRPIVEAERTTLRPFSCKELVKPKSKGLPRHLED